MQESSSFGNYHLIELLGRGGMGEVWRAHDTVIDRIVAIKILPEEISKDEVFQQRFRREAHAAARLRSPHIVPIHTHGEIDGRLFVEMGLIEGKDLQTMLDDGPLPPARAVGIIEQIGKALNAAHKVGLLHRDVKPSNILIDDDGDAYLIDFGIALAVGDRGLTTVGDVIGTFHYMAPERFKTQDPGAPPIDARSDIYALACVLYECLTAEHAFRGDSLEQQIGNHLVTPPPRPSATNPGLPRALDNVIAKGMAKKPSERYGTAVELARAARNAITAPMPVPRRPEPRPPVRPPIAPPRIMTPPRAESYGQRPIPAPQNASVEETLRQWAVQSPNSFPGRESPVLPRREPPAVQQPVTPRPPSPPSPSAPPTPTPIPTPPASPPWWRRKPVIIAGTALLTVAVVVVVMILIRDHGPEENPNQTTLPFTDLRDPQGLSVDHSGTVYVGDTMHDRVLTLAAGATKQSVLIEGLNSPTGVTADDFGTVYINDSGNKQVLILRGSQPPTPLKFTGLGRATGLTVLHNNVYVTDTAQSKVLRLALGAETPVEVLPFRDLKAPTGLTVDPKDGTIYVADGGNDRVLALRPGQQQETVPFNGLDDPGGVTMDVDRALYVTDRNHNRVLKLPEGSKEQIELPFTGLDHPWGLAVDNNGRVYVADRTDRIIVLKQQK